MKLPRFSIIMCIKNGEKYNISGEKSIQNTVNWKIKNQKWLEF